MVFKAEEERLVKNEVVEGCYTKKYYTYYRKSG
jgi:hypothetical protein